MAFTALDALREGYEVYPVVDAIGGTSPEAHRAGLERVMQPAGSRSAGSRSPVSWQRDRASPATRSPAIVEIVLTDRLAERANSAFSGDRHERRPG